jgi:uncharacterized protein (TIGR00645 family)
MTEPASPTNKPSLELWLEWGLFASRWLLAPMYVGLAAAVAILLVVFVKELIHTAPLVIQSGRVDDAVMMALSLIDLSLAANLLILVILTGYENFVSKIDIGDHPDRPSWMGKLDFSGLKMKLIASIVAISAVALLRVFMALAAPGASPEPAKLMWLVGLHLTFVVSGVLMAVMDWVSRKAEH